MPTSRRPRKAPGTTRTKDAGAVEVVVEQVDVTQLECDLLVVDAYEGVERFGGVTAAVDRAAGGSLARVLEAGDFKAKPKEMALVHPATGPARRILLVGLGKVEDLTPDRLRRVAAVVARKARDLGVGSVYTTLHGVGRPAGAAPQRGKPVDGGPRLDPAVAAEALAEGALLGLYRFERYKSKPDEEARGKPRRIVLVERDEAHARAAREGARVGQVVAESTNLCRDWAMLAGDDAAPARFGELATALARSHGLKVDVLDRAAIEQLGMGGLLGVAKGSAREPCFVALDYHPKGAARTVVLVGKGVTFDSGGISIKPAERMEDMKMDKAGAAAVAGAVAAAARLALPLRVVALMPFAENLPSGTAMKPGDVLTAMNGKTIEVINTDGEGRLMLADALTYADRYRPDAVVDLATLTGGCIVAVGHHAIAGMGNSDALLEGLRAAGREVNERVWPMPFFDEYGEMVKSKVADVRNNTGRPAHAITAGKFLENFIGDYPWAHLDIASTAYHGGTSPRLNEEYAPEPATGVGTRLLVRWMRSFEGVPWERKAKDAAPAKAGKAKSSATKSAAAKTAPAARARA